MLNPKKKKKSFLNAKDPSVAKIIQKQFLYQMEPRADILSLINTCIHCLTLAKEKEKYVLTMSVSEALRDEKRCNNLKKKTLRAVNHGNRSDHNGNSKWCKTIMTSAINKTLKMISTGVSSIVVH